MCFGQSCGAEFCLRRLSARAWRLILLLASLLSRMGLGPLVAVGNFAAAKFSHFLSCGAEFCLRRCRSCPEGRALRCIVVLAVFATVADGFRPASGRRKLCCCKVFTFLVVRRRILPSPPQRLPVGSRVASYCCPGRLRYCRGWVQAR